MEVALRLAETLFSVIPLVELVERHQPEVLQALNSNRVSLVCFVLNRLADGLNEANEPAGCIPDPILRSILSLVAHEELCISQAATKFLTSLALKMAGGLERILTSLKSEPLHAVYTKAEHILRISEMLVDLVSKEPSKFNLVKESKLLQPVLDGLLDADPLANLNFLQLAKTLATIPPAYDWLDNLGVLNGLLDRLRAMDSNSYRFLLLPGYLTFFGTLGRRHPSRWLGSENPDQNLVYILRRSVSDPDPTIFLSAIECIGHISGTIDGTKTLRDYMNPSGPLYSVLNKVGRLLQNSPNDVTVRVLDCLTELVRQPNLLTDLKQAVDQAQIKFDWAARVGQTTGADRDLEMSALNRTRSAASVLKRITNKATNPYPDIRLASLKAIHAFATQPWGVKLLLDQAGCMEYLLNRSTETGLGEVAQFMQAKYNIVEGIVRTSDTYRSCDDPDLSILLRPEQVTCLRVYIKEGIWGKQPSQSTVAMEPG